MTTAEFVSAVDWGDVRVEVLKSRAEFECLRLLRHGEIRAGRLPTPRDREQLARWANNIAACNELLVRLDAAP